MFSGERGLAAEAKDAKAQLDGLVGKIRDQLTQGKKTEADLAPLLKEFDALLAQHQGEKTDDVARILYMKATLYAEVLENTDQALVIARQIKSDFPETALAKNADTFIEGSSGQGKPKKSKANWSPAPASRISTKKTSKASRFPSPITKAKLSCLISGRLGAARVWANFPMSSRLTKISIPRDSRLSGLASMKSRTP